MAGQRLVIEPQHLLRRLVGKLQPALRIHHDDAFDHAGHDGVHPCATARQLLQSAAELLNRVVHRPSDSPELVVSYSSSRNSFAVSITFRPLVDTV